MKAIIKAAGLGSRLLPVTKNIPKTLVEVNGQPILHNILDALKFVSASPIVVIVGHHAQKIIDFCLSNYPDTLFHFIYNPNYSTKPASYSMYLAKEHMCEDILMFNCDVFFEKDILFDLIQYPYSVLAVDSSCRQLPINVHAVNEKIVEINDNLPASLADYSSLDILKLQKKEAILLRNMLVEFFEVKKQDISRNEIITNLIKYYGMEIYIHDAVGKRWCEIDTAEDLIRAEKIFKGMHK